MEPPSKPTVKVINNSGRRLRLKHIRQAVSLALGKHGCDSGFVNVLLTGDDEIRSLNMRFRSVDEPTDVLSFPGDGFPNAPLADIAISVEYAERQAAARRVSVSQELAYLAIHGALHVAGFDDEREGDRAKMV